MRLIRSLGALGDPSGDDLTVCPALAVVPAAPAVSGNLEIGKSRNLEFGNMDGHLEPKTYQNKHMSCPKRWQGHDL